VTEEVTGETTTGPGAGDRVEVEAPFYHEGAPQAFQRLWTPHRMVYIGGQNKPSDDTPAQCPFCTGPQRGDEEALIVHRGETSYVIMNLYPYNTGHLLVCPYRHISDWTQATAAERVLAILDVLESKLFRRGVSLKALDLGDKEPRPSGKIYRLACPLREGLTQEVAKKITKAIRDEGPKSVKATIQGDEVRVTSKSRDDLQTAIALLKNLDVDAALQFVNYR